jgi:hypothetical protein
MEYTVSALDLLDLVDEAVSNIKAETLEDTLNFYEGVFPNYVFLNISDSFHFSDALVTGGLRTFTIEDTLTFVDETAPRVLVASIDDFLFMWDVVDTPVDGSIHDTFVLTDFLVVEGGIQAGPDAITFTDGVDRIFFAYRTLEESLTLSDRCSCVAINALAPYIPQA